MVPSESSRGRKRADTPRAIEDCHGLLAWMLPQLDKFPRARRFTLGSRIEDGLLFVLEKLVEAAYSKAKAAPLRAANLRLEVVRHLWRLAFEAKAVAHRSWAHGAKLMVELGRQIAAAPFRDRVVHHALMNVIEPPLDRTFIHDSYACRRGKGVHRAVDRYQFWAKRYRFVLKVDIASYFASIDHAILKAQLAKGIKDPSILALLATIIDGSPLAKEKTEYYPGDDLLSPLERRRGIPIGNLTSQFFANFHLNGLDHFVKQDLKCRAYLRYVDDLILLADDKPTLWSWRTAIEDYLAGLRLRLHPRKCHLTPVHCGLDVLGYRVWPHRRQLRNDNGHRFARKLRGMANGYARGRYRLADFQPSIASWIGHARHGETEALRKAIFGHTSFVRQE